MGRSTPWIVWHGGLEVGCSRCGERIEFASPAGIGVRLGTVGKLAGAFIDAHHRCNPRATLGLPAWPLVAWEDSDISWLLGSGVARFIYEGDQHATPKQAARLARWRPGQAMPLLHFPPRQSRLPASRPPGRDHGVSP